MAISKAGQRAEGLIAEFGISSPEEIDVEAIAYDGGMQIRYQSLIGCEATLVGLGDKAIATINPSGYRGRDRFSISHEIGHWNLHRGKSFRCRVDDFSENFGSDSELEKEADDFASHLLMPTSLFGPAVKAINRPNLNDLTNLAAIFDVSIQAAAMRLATLDTLPVIVACYSQTGLRWSKRASHIPKRWWLRHALDDDSFAFDILQSNTTTPLWGKQPGETWFENSDADEYEVVECAMLSYKGHVLVLLYLNDPNMCEAGYDPDVGHSNRSWR